MKNYATKILVRTKPKLPDDKSATIKVAIENLMPIEILSCITGTFYMLNFKANNQCEALHMIEKIARELLSNDTMENYEIRSLEEIEPV